MMLCRQHLAERCQLLVSTTLFSRQLLQPLLFLLLAYQGSAADTTTSGSHSNQTTLTTRTSNSPSIPPKHLSPKPNCSAFNANITHRPCRSDGCVLSSPTLSDAQKLTEPCLSGNHEEFIASHFSAYKIDDDFNAPEPPTEKWLLFKDKEGDCMNILTVDAGASRCVMPGFCDSQFPWYLKLDTPLLNKFGSEANGKLCVTDITSLGIIRCCEKEINVVLRSCGHFTIYYLEQPMSVSAIGHVCADHPPSLADPVGERMWSKMSSISTKYTSANNEHIPKRLDELTEKEREGLITVVFQYFSDQKVNVVKLLGFSENKIKEKLEEARSRGKRELMVRSRLNIYRVLGTPEYNSNTKLLYYTIYAVTDSGVVIPQVYLLNAARELDNTEFAPLNAFVTKHVAGIPKQMTYPYKVNPTTSVSPVTAKTEHQNTADWKIIIYIIGFTCCTIVIVFIVLCIYRMRLVKNYRTNRGRRLSRLQWWLLCERSTPPTNMDLTLKQQKDSVKLVNGNCNGNGSTLLKDVECDNHT